MDTLLKTLGLVGSRAEGVAWGQRALKRKLLWPLEGRDVFEDSERLYNLEDSHPMVQRAREDAAKVPLVRPCPWECWAALAHLLDSAFLLCKQSRSRCAASL